MKNDINVGIVDDQHLFRQGLISLLKEYSDLKITLEASNGKELLDKLSTDDIPDVILLDIEMPQMNGIEALKRIRAKKINTKIIIITMHDEEEMVIHLIECGANGFIPKNEEIENVVEAIHSVCDNNYYFNDKFSLGMLKSLMSSEKITPKFKSYLLSDKELEIVKLICEEYTNKEIATKLNLSNRTIDGYRERILKKIGAKNTAGIVMYALKTKLFEL